MVHRDERRDVPWADLSLRLFNALKFQPVNHFLASMWVFGRRATDRQLVAL